MTPLAPKAKILNKLPSDAPGKIILTFSGLNLSYRLQKLKPRAMGL